MDETIKRHLTGEERGGDGGGGGGGSSDGDFEPSMDRFPNHIIINVLEKMDLVSLCTAACVSPTFNSAVAYILPSLPFFDLSGFYLDEETLKHVVHRVQGAKSLTIDCLQMKNDSSIINILSDHIEDLSLLKCSHLSYDILRAIGERCPNLRLFGYRKLRTVFAFALGFINFTLYLHLQEMDQSRYKSLLIEFAGLGAPDLLRMKLTGMLQKVSLLESLSIKIRGTLRDVFDVRPLVAFLPEGLKKLKLQQTGEMFFVVWLHTVRDIPWFKLQSLSLVLDVISDGLIRTVVDSLPLLVELDLEDIPFMEPSVRDLTNIGLQSLKYCRHLIALSIVRSRKNFPTSFTRVDNIGMFLLSEGCRGLESVKLGGFVKVTEAGFSSILYSCLNLKKFEVLTSPLLSDLAFDNMIGVARSLIELRLVSCRLLTSEAFEDLSSFSKLEVIDTSGCRSIGDPCLFYISSVTTVTKLNLAEADITDTGLAILGKGNLPIAHLCIRGCKRVTDKGIQFLFHDERKICKTLSVLDVGRIAGITDAAIFTIASTAKALTDLSLRFCFHVTDAALKMLVNRPNDNSSQLQRLDLCNCRGLSDDLIMLFQHKSAFRGLRWLGVGRTPLVNKREDFSKICKARPWFVVCFDDCEFGCHDGWQYHKSDD